MRFLLALVGLAALVLIALLSFGFLKIDGKPGALPQVTVTGGAAPEVTANMATITVGTEDKTIKVPTITVDKPGDKPGAPAPANSTAPK